MERGERIFSEGEAAEVLRIAARFQEEKGAYVPGLQRDELLRIAAEAGISPENVEAAIRAASARPAQRRFLNLVEEVERVVDAELDPKDFDVVLEVAKPARSHRHGAGQIGRTLTMPMNYKGGRYHVEISSGSGRTRVRVNSVPFMAYLMSLHPAIVAAVIVGPNLAVHGNGGWALAFALIILAVGMLAFVALAQRGNGKTTELTERIEEKVRERAESNLRWIESSSPQVADPSLHSSVTP